MIMLTFKKSFPWICSFFLFIQICGIAQQKPQHEKKVFVAPDGKMYWNKDLPMYIRVSTSKDEGAENFLLKSELTKKYADPFFLDTEGVNYLRSQWAVDPETGKEVYPRKEVVWEVYRDGTPPSTKINYEKARLIHKKELIYSQTGLEIILSATDEMSGVENIYYSLNQAPYTVYRQPIVLSEERSHEIQYYSVDNVGNIDQIHSQTILIDDSAPKSSYQFSGDTKGMVVSSKVKLELTSDDVISGLEGIYYKINGQPEKKYVTPVSFSTLPEGEHEISFFAKDNLGHIEPEQKINIYVDNTPPIITADLMGDNFIINGKEYTSTRTRVQLTAVDNKAGVKDIFYSINGGAQESYEAPFFLTGSQGDLKISYYAVDAVGNKSSNAAGKENVTVSYLDLSGPVLSYNLIGPRFFSRDTVFVSNKTKIELNGTDLESGMKMLTYSINKGEEKEYTSPFSLEEEGLYEIDYYGFDNVINNSQSKLLVVVDNEGPEIFPKLSISPIKHISLEDETIEVYSEHVVLFLAAMDGRVGYEFLSYSINNGKETEYISPVRGFKKGQRYDLQLIATDKLGNKRMQGVKFMIEE